MDLFDPTDTRPLHFMGVAGAGMSALALAARHRGVAVSGCDVDPTGIGDVSALGVPVVQGHDPSHLVNARALVVTAAIPDTHPEIQHARAIGIPVVPRKKALAELIRIGRVVAVAGTHGKTTTTVMISEALTHAGLAPTGLAGGRVAAWGGNALHGDDAIFVVEADEFDQAFLELWPEVAVVTNVEAEHLECYGTIEEMEDAFVTFADRARIAIIAAEDPGAKRVAGRLKTNVLRFGIHGGDFRVERLGQTPNGTAASVVLPDGGRVELALRVPGLHNLTNALAALAAGTALGAAPQAMAEALSAFPGVGRRFERLGEAKGIEFVDDYAHHPSELSATITAARQTFPDRRLVAVFQPHLYSRTARESGAMGQALASADLVVVTDVYAAREDPIPGVTGERVAEAARAAGAEVRYVPDRRRLSQGVRDAIRSGDAVLTLGAGDITQVGRELVQWLRSA